MQDLSEEGAPTLTVTIGENPPDRLDKALAREVPEEAALSRSRLMKMIAEGDVLRDGAPVTTSRRDWWCIRRAGMRPARWSMR